MPPDSPLRALRANTACYRAEASDTDTLGRPPPVARVPQNPKWVTQAAMIALRADTSTWSCDMAAYYVSVSCQVDLYYLIVTMKTVLPTQQSAASHK
ncbi:hypothetical protein SKAU_G00004430 [Synaphobranchus kaupii]|uniref:Uncharacterized protein n=1 Tax=Synaphobranchus kaupii TaxID=118154 RepID=A0A9Q1JCC2_SYNKA|nr:hypothetical protein SKAU_G00004430 [Synaphobranchus kaupii]